MPRWRKRNATAADLSFKKPVDENLVTDDLLTTAELQDEPETSTEVSGSKHKIDKQTDSSATSDEKPLRKISKRGTERTSIFARLAAKTAEDAAKECQTSTIKSSSTAGDSNAARRSVLERLGPRMTSNDNVDSDHDNFSASAAQQAKQFGNDEDELIIHPEDDPDLNPEAKNSTDADHDGSDRNGDKQSSATRHADKLQRQPAQAQPRGFLQALSAIKEAPDVPIRPEPRTRTPPPQHRRSRDRRRDSRDEQLDQRRDRRDTAVRRDRDDGRDRDDRRDVLSRPPTPEELTLPQVDNERIQLVDNVYLAQKTSFEVIATPPSSSVKITPWDVQQELSAHLERRVLSDAVTKMTKKTSDDHRIRLEVTVAESSLRAEVQACIEAAAIKFTGAPDLLYCHCPSSQPVTTVINPFGAGFDAKPAGSRPDTVLLRNIPCFWFGARKGLPEADILQAAFSPFGPVTMAQAVESKPMAADDGDELLDLLTINFDAYVQFQSVDSVLRLLASCQGRELQRHYKGKIFKANLQAELDTSEYLSKRNIRARKHQAKMAEQRRKDELARKQKEAEEAARREAERIAQEAEERRLAEIARRERLAREEEERQLEAQRRAEAERQRLKEQAERERLEQIEAKKRALLAAEEKKKQEAEERRRLAVEAAQRRAYEEMKAKMAEEEARLAKEEEELRKKRALEDMRLKAQQEAEQREQELKMQAEQAEAAKRAAIQQKLKDLQNKKAEERRLAALARLNAV